MAHMTTALLDTTKTALDAELAATTPAPTNFDRVTIRRTLDWIARLRQVTGEADPDYALRINLVAQQAPAGKWPASFWAQLEASIASDHGQVIAGGLGRSKS